jgi:pyruvate/2-oxoglutarate dehydrogenase complex dihydrolipoamide acyltransferase (E2) component
MAETAIVLKDEELGEDGEGELVTWLVENETQVTQNQPIAEVTTAKAVVTVEAPAAGRLRQIRQPGEVIPAGVPLGVISHE